MATIATTKRSSSPTAAGTTVALKILMASTGAVLVAYLIAHMYGNLKIFWGPEAFNGYAHHLRTLGTPILPYAGFLAIARVILGASVIAHIYSAAALWRRAKAARSTRYVVHKRVQQTYAARTMRWGGIIILLFVVFHLLQFTFHTIQVGGHYDRGPYDMVIKGFSNVFVVLFYALAVIAAGFHLRHGIWSATQTLGFTSQGNRRTVNLIAGGIALVVTLGFLAPPIAVLTNLIN